ncbi:fungal-specific transcription factor domain-containing protein [Vararia minispora EC-137]|uniref:Fungal-specific transcription factor domain-containing protein n=1 Tax=Vararia minispora EC-137 TaxID=1314806 RepID=A0ACB8QB17_9AGAM|nr:fungal-specific transcription factor domain-containing protein [Vararia minispora EC-137]
MSSSGDEQPATSPTRRQTSSYKKPRVARACDFCRRRKSDGGQGPGGKCASCAGANRDCSYVQTSKEGPSGYLEALEYKQERMEALLKRLHPNEDFSSEIGIHITRDNWTLSRALGSQTQDSSDQSPFASPAVTGASPATSASTPKTVPSAPNLPPDPISFLNDDIPAETKDEILATQLTELDQNFKSMHIASFVGKSGNPQTYRLALDVAKGELLVQDTVGIHMKNVRDRYWQLLPWERVAYEVKLTAYDFPDSKLLARLVDAYFENINLLLPVLHRPTFEKELRIGLHLHQEAFGAVVLLVCANGARFLDDRRVLLETEDEETCLSAGWKWFSQVQISKKILISTARLHDLQIFCLASVYLSGASRTSTVFNIVGLGLKLAQEIGVHKKAVYSTIPRAEEELFKRAFWVLLYLDRMVSVAFGRSLSIQEDERVFDVDFPVNCDDEYWTTPDPAQAFKQPPGKPSRISYFISALKLSRVSGLISRTIYASAKTKALYHFTGPEWEQRTLASFDSVLNNWADSVPDYLKWDPGRDDEQFFWQSAHLFGYYYHLQMILHRPFITSSKQNTFYFPSLAICVNAARSCSHILGVQYTALNYRSQERAVAAGTILMLGVWGAKRAGMAIDPEKEMEDVHKCMRMATHNERHWHAAGRSWDVLYSLVTAAEMPLPRTDTRQKRRLEDDANAGTSTTNSAFTGVMTPAASPKERPIAGSGRVFRPAGQREPSLSSPSTNGSFDMPNDALSSTLPTQSSDLGRMATDDPLRNLDYGTLSFELPQPTVRSGTSQAETFQPGANTPFMFGIGNEVSFETPALPVIINPPFGSADFNTTPDAFDALLASFAAAPATGLALPSTAVTASTESEQTFVSSCLPVYCNTLTGSSTALANGTRYCRS